jgi:colicin import membrane protein
MSTTTTETLRQKLETEERTAREKLERESVERRKAIAEQEEKERVAAEKAAAEKKEKEDAEAAKAAADREVRLAGNPASHALIEVSRALRAQGGFNDLATAAAFTAAADQLEGRADQIAGPDKHARHAKE